MLGREQHSVSIHDTVCPRNLVQYFKYTHLYIWIRFLGHTEAVIIWDIKTPDIDFFVTNFSNNLTFFKQKPSSIGAIRLKKV